MPVCCVEMTKYKSNPGMLQMCDLCSKFELEDARHFILRCPYFLSERMVLVALFLITMSICSTQF